MADNAIAQTSTQSAGGLDSLRSLARTPVARQLLLLVGVAAAVALGVAIVLWSRSPDYGLLYGSLTQKDASDIVQQLQAADVPYKLGADGGSVMVPADQVAPMRLKLAAQGLPQGSARSAAASGADSPFGMSDMAERTRYRQMLEEDLSSTIASLQSIRAARVHLALPKPSAFIRDSSRASASVVVTLFPGRQLDTTQVAAIVHLVASSVPNLDPGQVSLIDQQGQLLTTDDPDSPDAVNDSRMRMTSRIENTYAQRVEELLTPLVGSGRVRAQVHADVDFSRSETASETFGKDKQALRSEQVSSEQHTGATPEGGVPGALSNQPPGTVTQPTAANPGAGNGTAATTTAANAQKPTESSNSATRNFEVDRTIRHVSDPAGKVARLSVAVVVDNKQVPGKDGKSTSVPFTAAELQRLTELTKNAVGFDAGRGDSVSVINEAFHRVADDQDLPSTPFWQRPGVMGLIKQGLGVLAALLLAFGLLRPMLRGLLRPAEPAQAKARVLPERDENDGNAALAAQGDDQSLPGPAGPNIALGYEQKVGIAKRMASENPRQVAQIVKNWVATDGA